MRFEILLLVLSSLLLAVHGGMAALTRSEGRMSQVEKMCAYKGGTCVVSPSGEIECTNNGSYKLQGFDYPKEISPTNDKYIGVTCQSTSDKMCALTQSGKFRCYANQNGFPKYQDGEISAKTGKFVYINLSRTSHYNSLAAIREDGVMELWGNFKNYNKGDGTAKNAGLVNSDGTTRAAPSPNTVVAANSGGWFNAWLESDGKVKLLGYGWTGVNSRLESIDGTTGIDSLLKNNIGICALKASDGTYRCASNGYVETHTNTAKGGAKFIPGGCSGYNHMCGVLDNGKVECWLMDDKLADRRYNNYTPEEWSPASGLFVRCTCGNNHSCCLRDDNVIECKGSLDQAIGVTMTPATHSDGKLTCTSSNVDALTAACKCTATDCTVGKFCYDGTCQDAGKACPSSNIAVLTTACMCSTGNQCAENQYCYDNACHDGMKQCPNSNVNPLTTECGCGNGESSGCTSGQYCHENGSSCSNNYSSCLISWVRKRDSGECKCNGDNGPVCNQASQWCYNSVCNDQAGADTAVIAVPTATMTRMCGYRSGTCVSQPNGAIQCTGSSIANFNYPSMTNPTGDKYVGVTCMSSGSVICALTESGKVRCFNDQNGLPKYSEGDVAAKAGKFVYLDLSNVNSYKSLAAIRDDGVMELWGNYKGYNNGDGTAKTAGLVNSDGTTRAAPSPNKVVGAQSGGWFNAWLESDGQVKIIGYGSTGVKSRLDDYGGSTNAIDILKNNIGLCALQVEGTMSCVSNGYVESHNRSAFNGAKYVKGGCAGYNHICSVVDNGHVECWLMDDKLDNRRTTEYTPLDWVPSNGGKFDECACGNDHTCCSRTDGVLECKNKDTAISIQKPPLIPACAVHEITSNTGKCTCGTAAAECAANTWCYDDACQTEAKYPACTANFHVAIATSCACATQLTPCAVGKYCYGGQCQDQQRCNVRADVGKNVFYGAKVYGHWDAATRKMSMNLTHPWDVTISKIEWAGVTDTTLKFVTSNTGLWSKDESKDPCNPALVLDVDQTVFFGAGSKFAIAGSQLSSSLRVEASEAIATTKNGQVYNYNRNIKNTVPMLVNLISKTTISVRFRTGVVTPRNDFVLFTGAEDNFYGSNPNVVITMEVHSGSCVDHSRTDTGVRVKTGADNIAVGQLSQFAWTKNSNNEVVRTWEANRAMCVETLTWTFVPKEYKDNTYEIELEFVSVGTAAVFSSIAAINIQQADVLDDIGFTSTISTYSDEACTAAASTFVLGQKFYSKIGLTNLVVNTHNITCNTYKIKQTKDGVVTTTDLKAESKYNFAEVTQTGNNHVCGAELESHHFHVSVEGFDTVLETEILIHYDQTNTRRKLVSIPLTQETAIASALDDVDMKFRNTPRAPDADEMAAEMFIQAEEVEEVGYALRSGTKSKLINFSIMVVIVGFSGFLYNYFANKASNPYSPLVEM